MKPNFFFSQPIKKSRMRNNNTTNFRYSNVDPGYEKLTAYRRKRSLRFKSNVILVFAILILGTAALPQIEFVLPLVGVSLVLIVSSIILKLMAWHLNVKYRY